MSAVSILLISVAVFVLILLVVILVSQIKSNRHIESLKQNIEASRASSSQEVARPKVMKGAQPSKISKADESGDVASVGETTSPEIEPAPSISEEEPAPSIPVETIAVEIVEETVAEPETEPEAPEEAPVPEAATKAREFEPTPYPEFSNARAVEQLGLSQEEADMFISELVTQIEEEIPKLDAALAANDVVTLEKVSHMLKGSATNLGEGGVADVLVAFNTYCKEGSDAEVLQGHMQNLRYYFERLKEKFS